MAQDTSQSSAKRSSKNLKEHPSYTKWLTQGLIFSVAINLALLTSMVFNAVNSKSSHSKVAKSVSKSTRIEDDSTLQQALLTYSERSFADLIDLLQSDKHIEDGYTARDIALSILSHQHYLDVDRALMGQSTIVRYIPVQGAMQSTYEYPVFSGVTDHQYKLLSAFVQNEKWPLTSYGLFKRLQKNTHDETLKSAFYLSNEFMYIEGLFCSLSISKDVLLDILLEGSWDTLRSFMSENHQVQNFSNALRVQFLSHYLVEGSQLAARLILEIDAGYALKKLEDSHIVALLGLLEEKNNLAENFAIHLCFGNRSDWVRQEACRLLYHYANQNLPEPYSYNESARFIARMYHLDPNQLLAGATASLSVDEPEETPLEYRTYVVQDGDTLWKIAKKHQITLDDLREANQLHTDLIKVGMSLKIP